MDIIEVGKHYRVSYLNDIKCAMIQWTGMPSSDEFMRGCNTALEVMQKNGVSKILVDNSSATLFTIKDQQWLNNEWLPRAEKVGYRYSATVLGDSDAFVKFAAKNIASKRDQNKFEGKFFKTVNEAKEWLNTK